MSNQDRFAVTSAVITCEAEPEILRRAAGTHPPLACRVPEVGLGL
jgi:hypothetical protein